MSGSPQPSPLPGAPSAELVRELGLVDCVLLVLGAIIGSGIFLTPGGIARTTRSTAAVFFVWILGGVLTFCVLNETRGQSDPQRLGDLLRDLASRASIPELISTLPYTREAFDRLTGLRSIDWTSLARPPQRPAVGRPSAWVERVYRMPKESAEVIDRAIERFRESEDGTVPEWRVLELLAADYLGA